MLVISGGRGSGKTHRMTDKIEETLLADKGALIVVHNYSKQGKHFINALEQRGCPARYFERCKQLVILESKKVGMDTLIGSYGSHQRIFFEAVKKDELPYLHQMESKLFKDFTVVVDEPVKGPSGVIEEEYVPHT